MHLKQLVLKGFKSFAVRSVLSFEPGLSVVVGPNGSGKSNISDAVLWVLGEQSPKHLRGQAMEDVIFSGSSARKPVSVAEVELVLDNSDHTLPIEFEEVAITRRIYRSGESEYLINGSPCRLMDVRDVLHDTGLGRDAHTIISQGSLDAVIKARPEDRRMLIEEAAGILKHRERKERSARKIKAMDAHLERVRDLQKEVTRQLKPLERQASRARQHEEITAELTTLQLSLAVDDLRGLQTSWNDLRKREDELAAEVDVAKLTLDEREAELLRYQKLLEERGLFIGDLAEQRRRWQSVAMRLDAGANMVAEKGNNLLERLSTLCDTIERNERILRDTKAELADNEREREDGAARLAALEENRKKLTAQADELKAARREASKEYERISGEHRARQKSLGEARMQLSKANDSLANITFQDGVLAKRAEELDVQLDAERATLADLKAKAEALSASLEALEKAAVEADRTTVRLEGALSDADAALHGARERRDALAAERRALLEVDHAFDASNAALSRVLDNKTDYPQVVGRVSGVFSGDAELERLVEHLLGDDLQGLLSQDGRNAAMSAKRLSQEVAQGVDGQVAFMPVKDAHAPLTAAERGAAAKSGVRLIDELSVAAGFEEVAEALLGDVFLVDDIDAAVAAVAANPGAARYATREGAVCWPSGKVTVGTRTKAGDGVIARRRRIDEVTNAIPEAEEACKACAEAVENARAELVNAREQATRIATDRARAKGESESTLREISRAEASVASKESERASIDRQRADMATKAEQTEPLKAELEMRIQNLEKESADLEEQISASAVTRRERLASEESIERQVSESRIEVATLSERLRNLERRFAQMQSDAVRAENTLKLSRESARNLEVVRLRVAPLAALYRELSAAAEERTKLLSDRQRMQQVDSESLNATIGAARTATEEARARHAQATERRSELRVEKARLETQIDVAIKRIVEDLKVPLDTALDVKPPLNREQDEQRMAKLVYRLDHLGPVNPVAQQEYEQLKARVDYIEAQLDDLEGARKALSRIVNAIDRKMRQSFLATFDVVNENFKEIFARFFPGGTATLILTDPDNPDQTGIELDVQPKGKRIRRTQLMSGGEQALISIALLFAVYRTRSVPFYILDEVEPALDDTNLRRLTGFLDEMRHETQLIMITHQRRTMELADVLYGVSMQADGVSRLVSQRLDRNGNWVEQGSRQKVASATQRQNDE